MEFIEGESPKGLLPLETALGFARQIAAALEASHDKGIVHRTLRTAQDLGEIDHAKGAVMKESGSVKALDVGLLSWPELCSRVHQDHQVCRSRASNPKSMLQIGNPPIDRFHRRVVPLAAACSSAASFLRPNFAPWPVT